MPPPLPPVTLQTDDVLHGFRVTHITPLQALQTVAYQLTHEKSGARLLHLHNGDPENLFAVAFRTPPPNDTGLPHILEHTVLCGSRKYPVKDPFVELLKTSLATFLNAMTYPDKTVYPCASMNEKDFFNLADVYCDAVFHPLITEAHFKQEGHHFDFATPGDTESPLVIKGIVYNEMKGAYSDLDGTIDRKTKLSICPDNAYGHDSGGDPDQIPSLTYDQFVNFHKTYYHPSNSLIFIYGNIPTEQHLAFLDRIYLSDFSRISIDTTIEAQPRWNGPKQETIPYPIGSEEDPEGKAAVVLTYLTCDITDAIRSLSMFLLSDYLLGNAASPLRKALIDSKLGEDLVQSGYFSYQRDTFFCVGLRGTEAEHTDTLSGLVQEVCSDLVQEGLDKGKVEASFHRLEISSREIQPRYPLLLMDRAYRTWLYDADPLHILQLNEHLKELRRRYETEENFLEAQLEEMIVNNPHYTLLTFTPDSDYVAGRERAFLKRMEEQKGEMSKEELEGLALEAGKLDEMQSAPNTPKALASLPRLSLSDVPPDPFELDTTKEVVAGRPLLLTDIFSNGMGYLNLAFDLRGLEDDLVDLLPLFADALTMMGAAGMDYAAMAEREAAHTGGVNASVIMGGRTDHPEFVQPLLILSAKALDEKLPRMLDILSDRFLRGDLADLGRLKDVVLQGRAAWRSDIVPNGNHYASLYASRHLSRSDALAERIGGISQLRTYDGFVNTFDKDQEAIVEKLFRIRDFLLARGRATASFVGAREQQKRLTPWLEELLSALKDEAPEDEQVDFEPSMEAREGIAAPAEVAFVATAFPAIPAGHPDAPALLLLGFQLSFGYLWNEVRVKRGAYGARAGYEPTSGLFRLASYRDPCIRETLETYESVVSHVHSEMDLSPSTLEQAIIGTIKTLDQPIRPGPAVGLALSRHLRKETPEFRKRFRSRLLSLQGEDFRRVAKETLEPAFRTAPVCVLSSREKLTEANKSLGKKGLSIIDL